MPYVPAPVIRKLCTCRKIKLKGCLMSRFRCLKKSQNNLLAGVGAGMGEFVGWSPTRARAGWVIFGILSFGFAIVIYTILAFLFPPPNHFDLNEFRR